MEVLARDLRALGLYAARSLSYEGVEYELLEHTLTDEQVRIYDAYAGAFGIIHNNLDAAMQAANIPRLRTISRKLLARASVMPSALARIGISAKLAALVIVNNTLRDRKSTRLNSSH